MRKPDDKILLERNLHNEFIKKSKNILKKNKSETKKAEVITKNSTYQIISVIILLGICYIAVSSVFPSVIVKTEPPKPSDKDILNKFLKDSKNK